MLSRSWLLLLARSILAQRSDIILPDLNFDFPVSHHPVQFNISVHQSFLDFTARKVRDYRPTRSFSEDWSLEGPPENRVADVAKYWSTNYDWGAVEQRMNYELDHYATTVPGNGNYLLPIPLHFIHQRANKIDGIPLLLLHGWPSSYLEWSKVIKPLAQYPDQPFHIVAPDLPGFGFSPAPTGPGLGPREMGRAFDSLMHQLGYERYGIVTTDLGWFTGMWMVYDVQESILGHMTDFFVVPPNATDRERLAKSEASREEIAYIAASDEWYTRHWAYASVHGQKPLALSLSLADSPVGVLGWYWDINHATSDGYQYSHEQLITDAMMLWISGPYSNIRAYLEVFKVHGSSHDFVRR